MSDFIMWLDNLIWSTPLIILTFGSALIFCFAMKFGNITKIPLQWKLLRSGSGSMEGLSPFETFCSVVAYSVAVGNIGGVMVAILYGGPGAVFWMLVTALATSAVSYTENSLGQIYKIRQDGQYRGGPYFYMERGIRHKALGKFMAIVFALFCSIGVPILVTGPSANNIAMAFENSFGVARPVTGGVIALLLFAVISGGIRRIAKISTIIVPFMTIGYWVLAIYVMVAKADAFMPTIRMVLDSAFDSGAVFGGMMGTAFSYGVKRQKRRILPPRALSTRFPFMLTSLSASVPA